MAAYARRQFAGGAITTTVPLQVGSADASFTLAASTNWPDGSVGPFIVVIDQSSPEKILCVSRTGLVVTVAASGRGYDGTSAVSHVAGSQIQCVHGAQDDDEANQVVVGVLGQSGAAKGDILTMLSAAGPNTLTLLALGSTGQNIGVGGSGLPVYETVPGRLLASQIYAPGTLSNYALTTSLVAIDTTNATLSFTIPPSGNVDIDVGVNIEVSVSASTETAVKLGLLNHSGGAQAGYTLTAADASVTGNWFSYIRLRFHLTTALVSWTPGNTFQVDLAGGYGGSGGSIWARGNTGMTSEFSPLTIQAFAA